MIRIGKSSHSAEVQLNLHVGPISYRLGAICTDEIRFAKPIALPPCEGILEMSVDGSVHRWEVVLPEGASATESCTRCDTVRMLPSTDESATN